MIGLKELDQYHGRVEFHILPAPLFLLQSTFSQALDPGTNVGTLHEKEGIPMLVLLQQMVHPVYRATPSNLLPTLFLVLPHSLLGYLVS